MRLKEKATEIKQNLDKLCDGMIEASAKIKTASDTNIKLNHMLSLEFNIPISLPIAFSDDENGEILAEVLNHKPVISALMGIAVPLQNGGKLPISRVAGQKLFDELVADCKKLSDETDDFQNSTEDIDDEMLLRTIFLGIILAATNYVPLEHKE